MTYANAAINHRQESSQAIRVKIQVMASLITSVAAQSQKLPASVHVQDTTRIAKGVLQTDPRG